MRKLIVVAATAAACAAASVASDWPPLGPAWVPAERPRVDRCSQPSTLAEAHDVLAQLLEPSLVDEIRTGSESSARALNASFGMALRNMWGLWNGSALREHMARLGLEHPDDMSELVFVTFWRHLNDRPLAVESEVARLREVSALEWRPDPRCQCLPVGRCRTTFLVGGRLGRSRGFEVIDCCCRRIPQIVEGIPYPLPSPAGVMVLPPAMGFRAAACGVRFGAASPASSG